MPALAPAGRSAGGPLQSPRCWGARRRRPPACRLPPPTFHPVPLSSAPFTQCRDGLAVSLGQRLVVLNGLTAAAAAGGRPAVNFVSAVDAPEAVTALCWLAAGAQSTGVQCAGLERERGHCLICIA